MDYLTDLIQEFTENKDFQLYYKIQELLNKSQHIFIYENLPENLKAPQIEHILQTKGNCLFYKKGEQLKVSPVGYKHTPWFNREDELTKNVTPFNQTQEYTLLKNAYIMKNDHLETGLLPYIYKYAEFCMEIDITFRNIIDYERAPFVITAGDDSDKKSAELFLQKLTSGEKAIITSDTELGDGTSVNNVSNSNSNIIQLIELNQYKKSEFFDLIGININENMKRSYISDNDTANNNTSSLNMIQTMLFEREEALEEINKMFNTNISVSVNPEFQGGDNEDNNETRESETNQSQDSSNGGANETTDSKSNENDNSDKESDNRKGDKDEWK